MAAIVKGKREAKAALASLFGSWASSALLLAN